MTSWINEVQFKKCTCFNEQEESFPLENTIALYIVPTRRCNANCPFCAFKADNISFDIEIFKQRFSELLQIAMIDTVHFTGGEPSLEIDQIKAVCSFIKEVSPLTTISVNTNGSFIEDLCSIPELDNISLSRHHYDDKKNNELFGKLNVPNTERLLSLSEKEKLHLSCNLIKGYIDNEAELLQFLEFLHM